MIFYDNSNPQGISLGKTEPNFKFDPLNISRVLPIELDKCKNKYRGKKT